MLIDLKVTSENVDDLIELGITAIEGEEIVCNVEYEVNHADPSVGINLDDVQITSVTCLSGCHNDPDVDVESFFDLDDIYQEALQDLEDWRIDHQHPNARV